MALSVDDIGRLLATQGGEQYGREAVSQLAHALQCAQLAEQAGETPQTVVAALLHDLGHLLAPGGDGAGQDDLHQYMVIPFLRALLPDAVLEPIRLHVDAKRHLCATEPGYWETLSLASQHSLTLQGGFFTPSEAAHFAALPFSAEALRLRRYDDHAKQPGLATPPLAYYLALLERVQLSQAA
ncbi:phosphonate degradation HD-domain oxygenase [Verminephrobacter aporrectodeae]|uniref:phosphonate degradation HD-domain oxygenase n=1 Tax=Verminephrobacter aporrectodeae TaxID=1110389 RepID=UPI002244ED36|nr:phosphonate degradation HD-domain oxygenase [Verminephrobacter aporrectodeae]MCW8175880.1 HD domain-containing protein [Verminephrobacter aporrectodeae subsp. tuberculatae]MCW8203501.1 HD domain-containing protein [Verminephrobacter aporrectodeae subsp. tuberculatae]